MSDRRRLLIAALVLIVGVGVAFLIPTATCPKGGSYIRYGGGQSGCFTSDVGYAATSLVPLKLAVGIASVVAALVVVVVMLVRRQRLRHHPPFSAA